MSVLGSPVSTWRKKLSATITIAAAAGMVTILAAGLTFVRSLALPFVFLGLFLLTQLLGLVTLLTGLAVALAALTTVSITTVGLHIASTLCFPLSIFHFPLSAFLFLLLTNDSIAAFCQTLYLAFHLFVRALLCKGRGRHKFHLIILETLGIFLMTVHLDDSFHVFGLHGDEIVLPLIGIPHDTAEDIGLLIQSQTLLEADGLSSGREFLQSVSVDLVLEVETAFQLAALAS